MDEFYDPHFYELKIGPGSRVAERYRQLAVPEGGPILDLGCGTGDVLLPLARNGIRVVGLDCSTAMLEHCAKRVAKESFEIQKNVELKPDRMETFDLEKQFKQIVIPNDGIAHLLDGDAIRGCFSSVFKHLIPGGRILLDVGRFDICYLGKFTTSARELFRARGTFPLDDGNSISVLEQTSYDQETGILEALFRYEFLDSHGEIKKCIYRKLRQYPRRLREVLLELEAVGFRQLTHEMLDEHNTEAGILVCGRKE